jgi:hypothetical protein
MTMNETKSARPGQWLAIANAAGERSSARGDRGDLVAICDTEQAARAAGDRSGYHPGVLSYGVAGKVTTPRGCEVDYAHPMPAPVHVPEDQIRALSTEAFAAGDFEMGATCSRALLGDQDAVKAVAKALAAAGAMNDSETR